MTIKVDLLHTELERAGLPVASVRSDGVVRYTRLLAPEEEATASAVIAAHNPSVLMPYEEDERDAEQSVLSFRALTNWATWTPEEACDYVQGNILAGMDKATSDAWIDANVTSLATAKEAMKQLAGAIITTRTILKTIAMAIIYFRMIVVRRS